MNDKVMKAIIFFAGSALGGILGAFCSKKYYQKKYQKEADEKVASMQRYVDKVKKSYRDGLYNESLGYTVPKEPEKEKNEENVTAQSSEDYHAISEKYIRKKVYEKVEEKLAESEHPTDEELEEIYQESEALRQQERNEAKGSPFIISEQEDAVDAYSSRESIYYYIQDDIMVDENEELIPDYHMLIGDTLQESGFDVNDIEDIYVKNPSVGVIFEVSKIFGSYFDNE